MVKTIILDMDGTMFDTEPLWQKAFVKTGQDLGYNLTKELHDKTIGSNKTGINKILKSELGEDFPLDIFSTKYVENMKLVLKDNNLPIKTGLIELLNYLKDNNYNIAIASSSSLEIIKSNLNKSNIDEELFKVIVSGSDYSKGKPDPEIFIKACNLLGTNPKETIVIEDSNNGIKAAYNAGCIPILIPDLDIIKDETKRITRYQFNSLYEVKELLEK